MKIRNTKTGEVINGTEEEIEEVLSELEKSGEISDWETEEPTRTTYQERKDYFGGGVPGVLAEMYPNLAERKMQGNLGFNLGTAKAFLSDNLSMPGREISALANKMNMDGNAGNDRFMGGEFNLGQRSGDEGGTTAGNIVRDPITGLTMAIGGPLGKGVQLGAQAGLRLLGNAGRYIGAGLAGAAEGAGIEAASAALNDRDLTGKDLAIGAGLGGAFESAGTFVQQMMQRYGKDYVKAAARAIRLGNTDRDMTERELAELLKDPNSQNALRKVLELGSNGLNMTPFSGDRGKILEPEIQKAFDNAANTLRNQGLIDDTFYRRVSGTPAEQLEQSSAVHDVLSDVGRIEPYKDKTIWREGRVNEMDLANPDKDIYNGQPWKSPVRSKNKRTEYLSNPEYNLEKFDDKYSAIDSEIRKYKSIKSLGKDEEEAIDNLIEKYGSMENVLSRFRNTVNEKALTKEERSILNRLSNKYESIDKVAKKYTSNEGHITEEERKFIDKLANEVSKDYEIVNGYDPEKILSLNKFLGDRQPFSDRFLNSEVTDFLAKHPEGVSEEFVSEASKIISDARKYGNNRSTAIQNRWAGRYPSDIERAFSYAEGNPYDVVKGYRDAVDKFADDLSDYAKVRVGDVGKNAKGEMYIVGKENMKKYAYSYLKSVQEALENKGGLTAEEIVTLYGKATNVNDTVVQKAIIDLLERLGVSEESIRQFKRVGGNYAMLNKARTRMKKNSTEPNDFKGTMFAPIVPQEGFNARNAMSYRIQKNNIDTHGSVFRNDPTAAGFITRDVYNLGMTPFRANRDK